jgi:hypothetical protein
MSIEEGVRPNHKLFPALLLAGHDFMSDLIPALIHREVAEDGLGPQREERLPQLF